MIDDAKLHKALSRGDRAAALLKNELLTEAFDTLKQNYLDQLMATDVTQSGIRDKCYMAARIVDVVRDHLAKVISDGKMAKSQLNDLTKEAERKKLLGII